MDPESTSRRESRRDDRKPRAINTQQKKSCARVAQKSLICKSYRFAKAIYATSSIEGTNNAAERQLRDDATARKTGRTSKTPAGARRRSVISSVLQGIGKQLEQFTLEAVIREANQWLEVGYSCFAGQVEERGLSPPALAKTPFDVEQPVPNLLDRVVLFADTSPEEAIAT